MPDGFTEPGYRPVGPRSSLGRLGAVLLRWPDGREVYHRRYAHGGLCRFLRGERYASPRRLERELEAAARLRAAGVATAEPVCGRIERGLLGCRLALVTTRLEGRTLHAELGRGAGPEVLVEVGRSLARLHEAGFRHRDLHPGNVIVGPDGVVSVLDLDGGSWGGARRRAGRRASCGWRATTRSTSGVARTRAPSSRCCVATSPTPARGGRCCATSSVATGAACRGTGSCGVGRRSEPYGAQV
ncbi:MAG: lipopolysaccharide kinase InaA family protein [Planctomycetota bacterium]